MVKRGTVWISPEDWVPTGRMIDPAIAEFGGSWQDDRVLEDVVVYGADAAVEWGRRRSDRVLIRLGHSRASYFSAGDEHPAPDEEGEVPHWPPSAPPPEGWWYPPPLPTLDRVAAMAEKLDSGEIDQATAREWAEVIVCVHGHDLDAELWRALWALRGTDEPINR